MVHPCIVSGCKNKAKDGIYRFPRDLELRRKWLEVKIRMLLILLRFGGYRKYDQWNFMNLL